MSTISTNYNTSFTAMQPMRGHHGKPDASKMANDLFSQLDSTNKGYIEKSDLQSAFDKISNSNSSSNTDSTSNVDELFSKLDGNSDGKVTKDEMTSTLKKLSDELDSQFNQMRMQDGMSQMGQMGGMQGMPPPPDNDKGFSKDELQSQLSEIGNADSKRSSLINDIVNNFDKADSDGDGKVTAKEAMSYKQSQDSTATSTTSSDTASTSSSSNSVSDAKLFKQMMDLMHAYGQASGNQAASGFAQLSSLMSISAQA